MRLFCFIQLSKLQQIGQKKTYFFKLNFFEVTLNNGVLSNNLFVKPADTHRI